MKYMDIKPEPKTEYRVWKRWMNNNTSRLISKSIFAKKIVVI